MKTSVSWKNPHTFFRTMAPGTDLCSLVLCLVFFVSYLTNLHSQKFLNYDWGAAGEINNGNCKVMFGFHVKSGVNISVKDNVLYKSRYALIGGKSLVVDDKEIPQQYQVNFSGNTYIQNTGALLAEWGIPEYGNNTKKYLFNINADTVVRYVLGDQNGVIIVP